MTFARFSDRELQLKAFAVLEDAWVRALDVPIEKDAGIAFALAWLANGCRDRSVFDEFWKELESPERWRSANLTRFLNGIYLATGIRRDVEHMCKEWGVGLEPPIGSVVPGREANREWDQRH